MICTKLHSCIIEKDTDANFTTRTAVFNASYEYYNKLNVPLSGHRLKRKELDQVTHCLVLIYFHFLSNQHNLVGIKISLSKHQCMNFRKTLYQYVSRH